MIARARMVRWLGHALLSLHNMGLKLDEVHRLVTWRAGRLNEVRRHARVLHTGGGWEVPSSGNCPPASSSPRTNPAFFNTPAMIPAEKAAQLSWPRSRGTDT